MNSVLAKRWLRLRAYDHTMPIRLRDLIRLNRAQAAGMDPQRGNFFVACIIDFGVRSLREVHL